LIAAAKAPTEHLRIAKYYELSAQDYKAQAQEHEEMIAAYKANSSLSTEKNRSSTIGHWSAAKSRGSGEEQPLKSVSGQAGQAGETAKPQRYGQTNHTPNLLSCHEIMD